MIAVSDTVRAALTGSFTYYVRCESWLGDELLDDDVPIVTGSEESDRSLRVPERVTLTVPRSVGDVDYAPTSDTHPLAAAGQVLKISLGVGTSGTNVEYFQRGEFLITGSTMDNDTVQVTCAGLLTLVDEANFVSPFQPTGNISDTARALVEPAVTLDLDLAPTDRAVPVSAVNWDSDRLGAFYELLDAWAAVLLMNEQGYAQILADTTPTDADVVRDFTARPDDDNPTVITATGSSTRDGGFNVVVATGYGSDGTEVRGLAYVTDGPWAYGAGVANPLPVPFGYSSPLLTTSGQCAAAAQTVLARKQRDAIKRRWTVQCSPDPTLQLADPVRLWADDIDGVLCTVEQLNLPYTPDQMSFTAVEA